MVNDSDRDRLDALEKRIAQAQKAADPATKAGANGSGPMGKGALRAIRLASDFVALILGMAFFGWLADRQLDSAPWIMVAAVTVGFVGGCWMLVRALMPKDADAANDDETKDKSSKE